DGRRLVSGSEDYTVKIWDTDARRELTTLHGHTDFVYCAAFSPDGKTLATGGRDGVARLWRAATEQEDLARGRERCQKLLCLSVQGACPMRLSRSWERGSGRRLSN